MGRKKIVTGVCPLCLEEKVLVQSHIIPKFHWRHLKKEEGQYHILSNDPLKPERTDQREIKEHMLCQECDTVRLQRNEDHLARVLFGGKTTEGRDEGRLFHVKGFDYLKIKNALLSVLWRMSLSKHDFFKEVDLGEKHTERIRQILLNHEFTEPHEYTIQLCAPLLEGKHFGDWILPPDFTRNKGNRIYRCLISGFLFTFIIGSAEQNKEFEQLDLKDDGSWYILKADAMELPFLRHYMLELGRAHILRQKP